MADFSEYLPQTGAVSRALQSLVSSVPESHEPPSPDPLTRAQSLATGAALRAATLSGTMSLPPGPLGLATVLPDLIAVWRLQQQLIADIAATFGHSERLTPEAMMLCLFQHGDRTLSKELVADPDNGVLIRRVAATTLRQLLAKISIRVTQRLAAKGFSRWLPLIGALGVGAYAYYETSQVGANAIELFSRKTNAKPRGEKRIAAAGDETTPPRTKRPARRRKSVKAGSSETTGAATKSKPAPVPAP